MKAQQQYQDEYRNEHLARYADAPEGYVQGVRQKGILNPKAYLVALWCGDGLRALRALEGEEKKRASRAFRRTEAKLREGGTFTASSLLACIKAAFLALTAVPSLSQDFASEVEFVAKSADLADKDLGETIRLLAGYRGCGGKSSRGEDLSDEGKRGQAYIRACRAVNGIAGKPRNILRKTQVIRNLCQDSPFGEALCEVVLYLVKVRQAMELFLSCLTNPDVSADVTAEACAEYVTLRLGVAEVLQEFKTRGGALYDAYIEKAKEKRAEVLQEKAEAEAEVGTIKFRRSLDGGRTWTDEEVPLSKPQGKMRNRRRVHGIQTVSWEVLQEKAWRQEEALQEAEEEAVWE